MSWLSHGVKWISGYSGIRTTWYFCFLSSFPSTWFDFAHHRSLRTGLRLRQFYRGRFTFNATDTSCATATGYSFPYMLILEFPSKAYCVMQPWSPGFLVSWFLLSWFPLYSSSPRRAPHQSLFSIPQDSISDQEYLRYLGILRELIRILERNDYGGQKVETPDTLLTG